MGQTVEIVTDGKRLVVVFPDLNEEEVQELLEDVPTPAWWRLERTRGDIPNSDVRRWCAAAEYLWRDAEGLYDEAMAGFF